MTTTISYGRLGNQIIRNLAVSLIAEKYDLYVDYVSYELIKKLGIELFIGKNKYNNTIKLEDNNYFDIYKNENTLLNANLNPNENFFQTQEITNLIYTYLHSDKIKQNIINKNPFTQRYNSNNDIFIHIRLTDATQWNPGIKYYINAISHVKFDNTLDNIYISTDEQNHVIINQIIKKYPKIIIINYDEIKTFQFGSTCKNIILSHGSFSAIIGYLAFFSNVYYHEYELNKIWYGDMFSINGWVKHAKILENTS